MLFTEQRWWRVAAGVVAGIVLAGALGAPALATQLSPVDPADPAGVTGALRTPRLPLAASGKAPSASRTLDTGPAADATKPALKPVAKPAPKDRLALQRGDLDILAHLVQAEAGDEPYAGKVAVAAVVINRIQSGRFPRSVYGVVFEQDAFEAISNGWYWNPPSASAYRAVRDALRGWDPSGGALFFFNPAKTANAFVWSRPAILRIGNHLFTR